VAVRSLIGLDDLVGDPDSNALAAQPSAMGPGSRRPCRRAAVGLFEIEGGLAPCTLDLSEHRPVGSARSPRCPPWETALRCARKEFAEVELATAERVVWFNHRHLPTATDIRPNTKPTTALSSSNSGLESTRRAATNPENPSPRRGVEGARRREARTLDEGVPSSDSHYQMDLDGTSATVASERKARICVQTCWLLTEAKRWKSESSLRFPSSGRWCVRRRGSPAEARVNRLLYSAEYAGQ
jgi:hypothetical protein